MCLWASCGVPSYQALPLGSCPHTNTVPQLYYGRRTDVEDFAEKLAV